MRSLAARVILPAASVFLSVACATNRPAMYVAPSNYNIEIRSVVANGFDGWNVVVANHSSEPIMVTGVHFSSCENIWNPCGTVQMRRRIEPGSESTVLVIRVRDPQFPASPQYFTSWEVFRSASHPTSMAAAPAPAAAPATPAAPAREPSCLAVSFGAWSGPTGPLAVSTGDRVFALTPDLAPVRVSSGTIPAPLHRARLLDGPSFGDLAPAVPPVWAQTSGAGGLAIYIADTSKAVDIELVRSDSGLIGFAMGRTHHMTRDSSGAYTTVVARAAVRARPVPCDPTRM